MKSLLVFVALCVSSSEVFASSIVHPVAGESVFLSGLGASRSGGRKHQGVDFGALRGTPVVAVWEGVVARVGKNKLGGWIVWIEHLNGVETYYAHLNAHAVVKVGQSVDSGDVLGVVGDSGNARGTTPHLHFEIRQNGKVLNPMDYF